MVEDAQNRRAERRSAALGTLAFVALLAAITLPSCGSGTAALASGGGDQDALAVADVNDDGALIVAAFQAVTIHLNRD